MRVYALISFHDKEAGVMRTRGETWQCDDERAKHLEVLRFVRIEEQPEQPEQMEKPKPKPRTRRTRKPAAPSN